MVNRQTNGSNPCFSYSTSAWGTISWPKENTEEEGGTHRITTFLGLKSCITDLHSIHTILFGCLVPKKNNILLPHERKYISTIYFSLLSIWQRSKLYWPNKAHHYTKMMATIGPNAVRFHIWRTNNVLL